MPLAPHTLHTVAAVCVQVAGRTLRAWESTKHVPGSMVEDVAERQVCFLLVEEEEDDGGKGGAQEERGEDG